jgi:hypothetical protein
MNLIPDIPGTAPNYWCTWNLQEALSNQSQGTINIRNVLSEDFLIGQNGWAKSIFPQIKGDLILLLDDGWDIPLIPGQDSLVAKAYMKQNLSSFMLDTDKWPSLTGDPADRLSQLNKLVQKEGWKGIGVWVAAQEAAKFKDERKKTDIFRNSYWKERLDWSKKAKLLYWKVDWGMKCNFNFFRKRLSKLGRKIAPDLPIEHAFVTGPFNQFDKSGRVSKIYVHQAKTMLKFSDIFRLYDVCFDIGTSTMLDRLAVAFQYASKHPTGQQLLHTEDELYLAAASGCCMGIMRHPLRGKNVKMHEVVRAIKWQRIAPPFAASMYPVLVSDDILFDSHFFAPGSFWHQKVINTTIRQGAPAILARGLPLPRIEQINLSKNENPSIREAKSGILSITEAEGGIILSPDECPFIVASRNPTGAISIAALGRTNPERGYYTPKVSVSVQVPSLKGLFGIFGEFEQLILQIDEQLILQSKVTEPVSRIWAQDLGGNSAEDITSRVEVEKNQIIIPGTLIHTIGISTNPNGDPSDPGIVLKIE